MNDYRETLTETLEVLDIFDGEELRLTDEGWIPETPETLGVLVKTNTNKGGI